MGDGQEIYTLLNEIYLIVDDGDRRLLSQFSLTPPRYYALVHLGDRPGLSVSDLSDLMLCDKSNATRIVKSLEAEGLVYRKRHESDGRSVRLFLSRRGEELRRKALEAHDYFNQQRFEIPGTIGQDELLVELSQLKQHLHNQLERPGGS